MPHNSEQIRSFIAIELPQNVQSGLGQIRSELERAEHPFIKWVNPESIHLTLKFLGNIPFNRVTEVAKAMDEATQGASPFHLEISGLGGFPNLKQPRVIWVGIKGEIDKLLSLQQNIDSALALLGFVREERPFMPHLTLARIKERASPAERKSLGELVMSTSLEISYPFEVMAVSLMRSQLTPEGAVYTCQFAARLKA